MLIIFFIRHNEYLSSLTYFCIANNLKQELIFAGL